MVGALRPYSDHHNAMYVVGHDNKGVALHMREMSRDGLPNLNHCFPIAVHIHHTVSDFSEKRGAFDGADGDEVGAYLRVIEVAQAYRASAVLRFEIHHAVLP